MWGRHFLHGELLVAEEEEATARLALQRGGVEGDQRGQRQLWLCQHQRDARRRGNGDRRVWWQQHRVCARREEDVLRGGIRCIRACDIIHDIACVTTHMIVCVITHTNVKGQGNGEHVLGGVVQHEGLLRLTCPH